MSFIINSEVFLVTDLFLIQIHWIKIVHAHLIIIIIIIIIITIPCWDLLFAYSYQIFILERPKHYFASEVLFP